jgi:Cupredoxin-like domain
MKKIIIAIIALNVLVSIGCNTTTETKKENVNTNQATSSDTKNASSDAKPANFKAEFKSNPTEVKAGEQTEFSFTVKNEKGEIVKDLPLAHEKPMHLLVVSEDLAEFYHIHPELQADGSYKVPFNFTTGGNFKLYLDFTPKDSAQVVENYNLKVSGNERAKVELKVDEKLEKTVDGIKVMMKPDAELVAGKELMLNFTVFDEKTNKPITDLEKYLGEYAHFVIISQDLKQFVHAHPMSKEEHSGGNQDMSKPGNSNEKVDESKPHSHDDKTDMKDIKMSSPSEVSAHTSFPQTGLFKVFAQFQRGGKVIVVPFVVNVKEGNKKTAQAVENVQFPSDAKKVIVSKNGFEPSEISFKKGEPMKIAFYRTDSENCANEVVFKDINLTKKLPVGEVVVADLKDLKNNELSFACGMNMLKGKVLVQ